MGRAAGSGAGTRFPGAEQLPLPGTVYERVLVSQQVDVREVGGAAQLTIPVTNRGGAIGLLQLDLPDRPDDGVVADLAAAGRALAYMYPASDHVTVVLSNRITLRTVLGVPVAAHLPADELTAALAEGLAGGGYALPGATLPAWVAPALAAAVLAALGAVAALVRRRRAHRVRRRRRAA